MSKNGQLDMMGDICHLKKNSVVCTVSKNAMQRKFEACLFRLLVMLVGSVGTFASRGLSGGQP